MNKNHCKRIKTMKKLIITILLTVAAIVIPFSIYNTGKSTITKAITEMRLDKADKRSDGGVYSYLFLVESIDKIVKEPHTGKDNLYVVYYTYTDLFVQEDSEIYDVRFLSKAYSLIEIDGLSVKALGYDEIKE